MTIYQIIRKIVRGFVYLILPKRYIRNLAFLYDPLQRQTAWRNFRVSRASSIDEVRRVATSLGFRYFIDYDKQIATKRREFKSAITFFGISLDDKRVLDVGPGTADSLDVAKQSGASETLFIEEEPVFVRFAVIKGHKGVRHNYTFKPFFPSEWKGTIDFIYTKGSINCQWVNEQHELLEAGSIDGYFDFAAWVVELIDLLKPGGVIVLLPAMWKQPINIVDDAYDLDTYYWCPDVPAYKQSYFTQTLLDHGFIAVDNVPGLTQEKAFPLAFYFDGKVAKLREN